MMYSMHTVGGSFFPPFFVAFHMLAGITLFFGVLFLLFWSWKKLSEEKLWKYGWALIGIGVLFCLLLAPFKSGYGRDFDGLKGGRFMMPMMWNQAQEEVSSTDTLAQDKEEKEGQALFEKLQSNESTCADLSDADFELIGEYFMGQRLGVNHIAMNDRMKQMMGEKGEEQMHITLGRSFAGCPSANDSQFFSSSVGGMMKR